MKRGYFSSKFDFIFPAFWYNVFGMNSRNVPLALVHDVFSLDPGILVSAGIRVLLMDLDNTLVPYGMEKPEPRAKEFVDSLKAAGIVPMICSNGLSKRVAGLANALGIEARGFLRKPCSGPLRALIQKKHWDKKEVLFVGDQIQTDVRAANGAGIRVLLSDPLWPKEPIWTKINRIFEKPKRKKVNLLLKDKDWKEAISQ